MSKLTRRGLLKGSVAVVGAAALGHGPVGDMTGLQLFAARAAAGQAPVVTAGYGPLVNKGDIWLPAAFNYQVISVQGTPMSDGNLTPGIFDGMAAYPGRRGRDILIRNHENREQAGEIKVVTGPQFEYDETARGGNTKLEVSRRKIGRDKATKQQLYQYTVERSFAILGGTSTNCAGGIRYPNVWLACEEVVKRTNGKKHGYIFEIDAYADGPVPAIPITQAGRRSHEAALVHDGILYMTEDRSIIADALTEKKLLGACFYRYLPTSLGNRPLHQTRGKVQALKLRDEFHANMDIGRVVGQPYPVEWVDVPEPDHDDDTDNRRDRVPGFTPNRVAAQDRGAAFFDRQEGMWATGSGFGDEADDNRGRTKIYFDCTSGGAMNLGQVWEFDPRRQTLTLIYESNDIARLEGPDNIVVVPKTGDIFLCEDAGGEQYVRGVTPQGEIYDFIKSQANDTEFCGACFSPDGKTLYVNQQGDRGSLPGGPAGANAVTYAIYGPFQKRAGLDNEDEGDDD
jgi:secreted PhoX family phosphatase